MRQGDYNKELKRLLQVLGRQTRLHAEAMLENQLHIERDKVLCDLLVHQEFFEQVFAAMGEEEEDSLGDDSGLDCSPTPPRARRDLVTVLQQATAAAVGQYSHQHESDQHQQQQLHASEFGLPDSYVARLLRQACAPQIERVLQMTAQDWVQFFADLFPQVLSQLEVCSRSEYDYDPASMPAVGADADACAGAMHGSDNSPEDGHMQQAARCLSGAAGSALAHSGAVPDAAAATRCPGRKASQPQQWCWQQQPLGASPAIDRELLRQTIDSAVQLIMLAWLLNHVPALAASDCCLNGGPSGQPGLQHWEAVADRLQLTDSQELQISICMAELRRMDEDMCVEGGRLLQSAGEPTLQLAAALQQQQQCEQPSPGRRNNNRQRGRMPKAGRSVQEQQQHAKSVLSSMSCAPVEDTELELELCEPWQERVAQQLQHHVCKRHVQLLCVQSFVVNTLSRHQLAMLMVASFPYIPATFVVAEIVSRRVEHRQQQQLRQLQKAACTQHSTALGNAWADDQATGADVPAAGAAGAAGAALYTAVPYSRWFLQQHEQKRADELLLHQRACWAQLDCLKLQPYQPLPEEQQQQPGED